METVNATEIQKGAQIAEGKTKILFEDPNDSTAVIVQNKEDITAFDNPAYTKQFKTKAEYATTTTCRVFELLQDAGIPVAYREQLSPTEFRADKCRMISLEVITRRYVIPGSSYLKRHPEINPDPPFRFPLLFSEFFLKTNQGGFTTRQGERIELGLDADKGEEDPYIVNPYSPTWELHSKKPSWENGVNLGSVSASNVVDYSGRINDMDTMLRGVFLVLEGAWGILGHRILDIKIEFGLTRRDSGVLVVSDVIDNDSWRLRDPNWQELSKQSFRDGEDLEEVERKYALVAGLVERFIYPDQALVHWRGSSHDEATTDLDYKGLKNVDVVLSGHKSTGKCLEKLNGLQREYTSGVILAKVGRSNGLAPILAAHSTWPVIAIPATIDDHPEDIWSSIRMPSLVPLLVCGEEDNAEDAAMNIMAARNPFIYMDRQLQIEKLEA